MKLKTTELQGPALDWAVAKCEFPDANTQDIEVWVQPLPCDDLEDFKFQPSTKWAQGGSIIELSRGYDLWTATLDLNEGDVMVQKNQGPTPLIAAMRCYVASKLGDEVEVPGEVEGGLK